MVHAGFCYLTCPAHCFDAATWRYCLDRLINALKDLRSAFCMPTMKGRRHRVKCSILGPTNG